VSSAFEDEGFLRKEQEKKTGKMSRDGSGFIDCNYCFNRGRGLAVVAVVATLDLEKRETMKVDRAD
jgi:hypothetical protein